MDKATYATLRSRARRLTARRCRPSTATTAPSVSAKSAR